jgi:superfamily II DNA or RNA helicase
MSGGTMKEGYMQSNFEFNDRHIRLPEYVSRRMLKCGVIEQVIIEKGDYAIAACRSCTPKRFELDLRNCRFGTIMLQEGKGRLMDTDLPCTFTTDSAGTQIEATSWKLRDPIRHVSTADQVGESWENALRLKREVPGVSIGFRNAQVGAIHAVLAHWSVSHQPCTVVLPTGTGKTETMLGLTVAERAKLVLVIVPTQDLRAQIAGKFRELGILKEIGVLDQRALLPRVATLSSGLTEDDDLEALLGCNVIVSTPDLLSRNTILFRKLTEEVSHVFFDEAHHIKAPSWQVLKKAFGSSKVVQFTATPYRLDRQPIDGKVVYQYSLERAQKDGCFSEISLITVNERNPNRKDASIAITAFERLQEDRRAGYTKHCMMVRAGDRSRADGLYELYCTMFPGEKIAKIYSGVADKKAKLDSVKRGEYAIIVCVDMLKEGFDFPEFKIAAVHDLHKSLAVAMQFIGRFTRDRKDLGKAHMVVNFAEAEIPRELEKLYADGSGWSKVISEVAQSKQQEAIEFIEFLADCEPYKTFDDPDQSISPRLVNPALSCVVYRCASGVDWSRFREAFPENYRFSQPYENPKRNLFYFSAQVREPVKWTRSEAIRDQLWTLVIMHYAEDQKLLYIGCSDKKFKHEKLVETVCIGEHSLIERNPVFRSFQNIKRRKIIHAGLLKPANRNSRYAKYSGADVTAQLAALNSGGRARKSDFVATGYRDGKPVGVGASQKGKIWNPARVGNPKEWIEWCTRTGALLIDESIDTNQIFKDTAKVTELDQYPVDNAIIAMDWNEETFERHHRMALVDGRNKSTPLYMCEFAGWRCNGKTLDFEIRREGHNPISLMITLGDEDGHSLSIPNGETVMISGWRREDEAIEKFFVDYPPTLFLADGSLLSGCQHTVFNSCVDPLPDDFFEPWDWDGVDIEKEAAYKSIDGQVIFRENSVQQRVMEKCKEDGAVLVFNDDGSGESADVVAVFENQDALTLKLLHCKFSKGANPGHRVGDLYEVCGQAVKSVKWRWEARNLIRHLQNRKDQGLGAERRLFHGSSEVLAELVRKLDYAEVRFEFWIVQPGLVSRDLPDDLISLLTSCATTVTDMTECRLRCISN